MKNTQPSVKRLSSVLWVGLVLSMGPAWAKELVAPVTYTIEELKDKKMTDISTEKAATPNQITQMSFSQCQRVLGEWVTAAQAGGCLVERGTDESALGEYAQLACPLEPKKIACWKAGSKKSTDHMEIEFLKYQPKR